MSTKEHQHRMFAALQALGISWNDAQALRRISMTLQRWGERECGDEHGDAIERDEDTGIPYATWDRGSGPRGRAKIADKEKGALKRLAAIMAAYPELVAYHQTDPRGASLYILKRSDLKAQRGEPELPIESFYTRGVAVYK